MKNGPRHATQGLSVKPTFLDFCIQKHIRNIKTQQTQGLSVTVSTRDCRPSGATTGVGGCHHPAPHRCGVGLCGSDFWEQKLGAVLLLGARPASSLGMVVQQTH